MNQYDVFVLDDLSHVAPLGRRCLESGNDFLGLLNGSMKCHGEGIFPESNSVTGFYSGGGDPVYRVAEILDQG